MQSDPPRAEGGIATYTPVTMLLPAGDDWLVVTTDPLAPPEAMAWASLPACGAVVSFCGNVRDHAGDRTGVVRLRYEAYEEYVVPRLAEVAAGARRRWPELGRLALWQRVGELEMGESAVVVVASTPHRAEAFAAASFCIDTLKVTLPVWKQEIWEGGRTWVAGCPPARVT